MFDKVIEYPTKVRTVSYDNLTVSTKDGKNINIGVSYSYKVDATKATSLFKEFGNVSIENLEEGYLQKRVLDAVRTTVSSYNLLDIYGESATEAGLIIQEKFQENVQKKGFIVSDLALGAPSPDKATQKAIDARIAAAQENERKKLELENEKIQKEIDLVQAEAKAEKKLIAAEAEAKALELKAQEITEETLKQEWIQKWNGVLPTIQAGEGVTPIVQMP